MSCPVPHNDSQESNYSKQIPYGVDVSSQSACPIASPETDPSNNMPKVAEQSVWPGQKESLQTDRIKSSIPKGNFTPPHQKMVEGEETWVYPSEQQFYNAMKRKGWDPKAKDMSTVVAIHNAVNERSWNEVLRWEKRFHCDCENPKLLRFQGKPKDPSPKARFLGMIGYNPPFDRHDWVVDRCGQEVRYIIDFYRGRQVEGVPASFHIDARPALDTVESLKDRVRMTASEWFGFS